MGIGDISSVKWFGLSDDIINANYVLGVGWGFTCIDEMKPAFFRIDMLMQTNG